MVKLKKFYFFLFAVFLQIIAFGQNEVLKPVEKESFLRSDGKIYVVVLIVVTILAGLIFYVARIDKKLSGLEKLK